jgi:mitochondrial import inner membrane translocase subunit TIM22
MGAFFSMMSSSFQYDDPLARTDLSTRKKTAEMFKEMGRGMYRSGRSFGKVGALYSGIECIIESVSKFLFSLCVIDCLTASQVSSSR